MTSHLSGSLNSGQRRAETYQPAPRRSVGAEMVWDYFSVSPPPTAAAVHFSLRQIVNHTPVHERSPWTGEDKSAPLLPSSALYLTQSCLPCGRLSSGSQLVKCNRLPTQGERGWLPWAVCHGGNGEVDVGGRGGWLVAFKRDLFEKQQTACLYLRLQSNVAIQRNAQRNATKNNWLKEYAIKLRNGAMLLFCVLLIKIKYKKWNCETKLASGKRIRLSQKSMFYFIVLSLPRLPAINWLCSPRRSPRTSGLHLLLLYLSFFLICHVVRGPLFLMYWPWVATFHRVQASQHLTRREFLFLCS